MMRRILWVAAAAAVGVACGQFYEVGAVDTLGRELGGTCGNTQCPQNEVCCNESCGICVPPNGVCTQQVCGLTCELSDCGPIPGGPLACADGTTRDWVCQLDAAGACGWTQETCPPATVDAGSPVPCGNTTCGAGLVCCNASCGVCTVPGGVCTQQVCPSTCGPSDCGPTPGGPLFCADGTTRDWECKLDAAGACGWTQESCPAVSVDAGSPVPCGKTTCGAGLVCCNASCGVCTVPGGVCTQQVCP